MTAVLDRARTPAATQDPVDRPALPSVALSRLEHLADPASLRRLETVDGVIGARARIRGVETVVFATDPSCRAGALGAQGCRQIAALLSEARRELVPVVGVWHSAGARVQEGVRALDGMGQIFAAATAASGQVPHIALVLGTSAGGAAYGPALADVVVTGPDARLFVTGPSVVNEVTGEQVDGSELGGPEVHGRRSGLVHVTAASDTEAYQSVGRLVRLLARPAGRPKRVVADVPALEHVLPARRRRAYDVRPLLRLLLDRDSASVELQPAWAPNLVTVLGRLDGRSVGMLANNPLRLGGCLDGRSSDKAARFVRMCDALGVPLVVVVDVPGFLPGVQQEWEGVVRRGAKLLHAFAEATVPRVTLITHKAFGGAYIAMNSRSLGATTVLAWPSADIAVMGPEAAARIVHRKALELLPAQQRPGRIAELAQHADSGGEGLAQALELGLVDAVIPPATTRRELASALSRALPARGRHGNIPL